MKKAIFLDRDGVLIECAGFISGKEEVVILPKVEEALKSLKQKGYLLIVVSNQPVIARGLATPEEIKEINVFLNLKLNNVLDALYFCPHHPDMHSDVPEHAIKYRKKCDCRKPLPGMLVRAAKDFNIDLKNSWMVGDKTVDVVAGKRAGCRTIIVRSPENDNQTNVWPPYDHDEKPDFFVNNLLEATKLT